MNLRAFSQIRENALTFLHFVSVFTARDAARFPKGPKMDFEKRCVESLSFPRENLILSLKSELYGIMKRCFHIFVSKMPLGSFSCVDRYVYKG